MPHGNRVSSSSALKMTGIWTNTIGYDPYAAEGGGPDAEDEANAFEQAQGLMALAKLSNQGVSYVGLDQSQESCVCVCVCACLPLFRPVNVFLFF